MITTWDLSDNVLDLLGREPTQQEAELLYNYTNEKGIAKKLIKRIGKVNIDHPIIMKAFCNFVEKSGSEMKDFRLLDLLSFNESVCKEGFVYGNVGDCILCFSQMPKDRNLAKQIYNNSVNGIYELLDRTNGIAFDLSQFPNENMSTLGSRRFVFADRKKAVVLTHKAMNAGISVCMLGFVTSEKRIKIMRYGINEIDIDKQILIPDDNGERLTVSLNSEAVNVYKKAYLSVFGYKYCISALQHNQVVLGTSGDISHTLAMLLGIYSASKVLSLTAVKIQLTNKNDVYISTDNLNINYGDKVYLIKPFCNSENMPLVDSYTQINSYIYNRSVGNSSITVYPVINNLNTSIDLVMGNNYHFDPSQNFNRNEQAVCSVLIISPIQLEGKFIGVINKPVEPQEVEDSYQI